MYAIRSYYDLGSLKGAKKLAGMDSVVAKDVKLGKKPLIGDEAVKSKTVIQLGPHDGQVEEGSW